MQDAPRWFRRGDRALAIGRLTASIGYLERCTRFQFSMELIVQALDLMPAALWNKVVDAAKAELAAEALSADEA